MKRRIASVSYCTPVEGAVAYRLVGDPEEAIGDSEAAELRAAPCSDLIDALNSASHLLAPLAVHVLPDSNFEPSLRPDIYVLAGLDVEPAKSTTFQAGAECRGRLAESVARP
jgi:hypothetical protein